jgi:hypothetical protein
MLNRHGTKADKIRTVSGRSFFKFCRREAAIASISGRPRPDVRM